MEKEIKLKNNGFFHLLISLVLLFAPLGLIFYHEIWNIPVFILLSLIGIFLLTGLFIIQPNQTSVLVFFGKYQGTVKSNGFFWLNPFYNKKKASMVSNLLVVLCADESARPVINAGSIY